VLDYDIIDHHDQDDRTGSLSAVKRLRRRADMSREYRTSRIGRLATSLLFAEALLTGALLPHRSAAQMPAASPTPPTPRPTTQLATQSAALAAADSLPTISLTDALQLALRTNPAAVQSAGAIQSAIAGQRTAMGAYLPSLGVASSGTRGNANIGANAVTGGIAVPSATHDLYNVYGSGVSSTLPLFTGGRRSADRAAAREQRLAAEANDVAVRFDVLLFTKSSYFEVLRAAELMAVAKAQVEQAQTGLQDAEHRLHAGTTTKSDMLRAQVALAEAKTALATATTRHSNAQFALARAIGRDDAVDAQPLSNLDPTPLAMGHDSLIALITSQAPSVRAAAAASRAADASVGSAKAQYLPAVMATGGYSWFDQKSPGLQGLSGWSVQVGVSYPLFNGFQREATVTRAQVQARSARSTALDATRAARSDAETALGNVTLAAQRIALATEAANAAREDLRVQQARYRAGASTFLDEVTSQLNLAQAETALVDARYDYQIARAELDAIAGREL